MFSQWRSSWSMRALPSRLDGTRRLTRVADVCTAFALLTYYWCVARVRPHAPLKGARAAHDSARSTTRDSSHLHRIVSAVERASALHPLHPRCLEQALAAKTMLALRGERATVVIGVNRSGEPFSAHAWVQVGELSIDASRPSFSELTHLS